MRPKNQPLVASICSAPAAEEAVSRASDEFQSADRSVNEQCIPSIGASHLSLKLEGLGGVIL